MMLRTTRLTTSVLDRLSTCRRNGYRWASVALLVLAGAAPAETVAPPPSGVPVGTIAAFLPNYAAGGYTDNAGLKVWLADQGWLICDGNNGTPDLHNRLLLGTERPEDTGQNLGSLAHDHGITGETLRRGARDMRIREGIRHPTRVAAEHHQHKIEGKTGRVDNLPPSTRVLFIMKTRD